MSLEAATKVTAGHLARTAYLYVRQSTLRQVMTNTESATRQYGLRQRAVAMGWAAEQIVVIDCDQGQSGSSAVDREGFQRLAAEVGMGRAGIVLGLEVSRLARNNADWHRLLELCALGATLICDEDGLYDPCDFNDRLLLGLKGTMSEAELHFIRARLRGGISPRPSAVSSSSPFRSGSSMTLPITSCWTPTPVCSTPIRHLFATFARTGSARAVVQTFAAEGLQFPLRVRSGPAKGELAWEWLAHWRVLRTLHNPRYAGAFFFGRHRWRPAPGGKTTMELLPRDKWIALIPDAHPGYIGLGRLRGQPDTTALQRPGRGIRPGRRARSRRHRSAPGTGHLRALRTAHDRALSPPAGRGGPRLPVHGDLYQRRCVALPERARRRDR